MPSSLLSALFFLLPLAASSSSARAADHWAFQPLRRPPVPLPERGARNPIDSFILAALAKKGIAPAPPADRRTLIRRATFDVTGLPPTPEEVDSFLADRSPRAYEALVDRLLASPHYGERWARHWLDVVHYADTHGYDKDKRRDNAWPYRDYVIRALNVDRPYSRFIREQIAGDILFPEEPDGIVAAGFVAAGPWDFVGHTELREGTVEKAKTRSLDRDDMVANTLSTFNSLTVHCARCHDHKFDPISQKDYYRLQAVFADVERGDRPYSKSSADDPKAAPRVYSLIPAAARPIQVLIRGDVESPGESVTAGALSCAGELSPELDAKLHPRAALAEWIADRRNPLTWRSIVNRVWQYHFGRGLVETPNVFGRNGARPSNPELLDWLAVWFRDNGQSLKKLHRLIMTSEAYRRSARHDPGAARVDADNRLLWRMNRRRLDAETVRDSILAVSGKLDRTMGGPGFELFRFKDDHSPVYDHLDVERATHPSTWRRTVYRFVVRSVANRFLESLDCADPNISTPVRNATITSLQALALLNDPFILQQSGHLAERLAAEAGSSTEAQIERLTALLFNRPPGGMEKRALSDYASRHGMTAVCRLLLNTNEFLYVD